MGRRDDEALTQNRPQILTRLIDADQDSQKDTSGSPRERKAQIFETLTLLIDRMGIDGQNLFIIEDIHWIDPTTQEFLDHLVERVASLKAMFVCTYRPEHHPNFIGQSRVSLISLSRLDDEQSAELMTSVLREHALPPDVESEIVSRADGIPFFIEELAKSAIEIGSDEQEQSIAKRIRSLPTTLHGSLLARLDRVPGVSQVAPIGAAIGRTFPHDLLLSVSGLPESVAQPVLDGLLATGLLVRSGCASTAQYTFKHALVRDAAYNTMPKSRRMNVHHQIAKTLESSGTPNKETLARHFSEAGKHEKACDYWKAAAIAADRSTADAEAVTCIQSALSCIDLLDSVEDQRAREIDLREMLRIPLARARMGSRETETNLERLLELRGRSGSDHDRLSVVHGLAARYVILGEVSKALDLVEEIFSANSTNEGVAMILGFRVRGFAHFLAGRFDHAIKDLRKVMALADTTPAEQVRAFYHADSALIARAMVAWSYAFKGEADAFLIEAQLCKTRIRDEDRWSKVYALSLLSSGHQVLGHPRRCLELASEVRNISEDHSYDYWVGWSSMLCGWALTQLGRADEGEKSLLSGLDLYHKTGSRMLLPYAKALVSETALKIRELSSATINVLDLCTHDNPPEAIYAIELLDRLRSQG